MPTILILKCDYCEKQFDRELRQVTKKGRKHQFCNNECFTKFRNKSKTISCKQCDKPFAKQLSQIKKTKNHFCSKSCSCIYQNTHKTTGYRRSKLEVHLEEQISIHYPNLNLITSDRKQLDGLELDFYFPDISLAIELNGIFHYQPIFGEDKFSKTKERDQRKFVLCDQKNIALAIIDSSSCSYLTQKAKDKYWSITQSIIDRHLNLKN